MKYFPAENLRSPTDRYFLPRRLINHAGADKDADDADDADVDHDAELVINIKITLSFGSIITFVNYNLDHLSICCANQN